jgi:hypothetical protein
VRGHLGKIFQYILQLIEPNRDQGQLGVARKRFDEAVAVASPATAPVTLRRSNKSTSTDLGLM